MVYVKGHGALANVPLNNADAVAKFHELGLASEGIKITPKFVHKDIHADDLGDEVPADVMWMLAEATVSMTLVHYDRDVLRACVVESMAGGGGVAGAQLFDGTVAPAGSMMGRGAIRLISGCHYISLNIASPVLNEPWRFLTTYLADRPVEIPLGTQNMMALLNWRAIPYAPLIGGEAHSSGAVVWDHTLDVD